MKHRTLTWSMTEQDKHALMVVCSQFSHLRVIKQQLRKAWDAAQETETQHKEQNNG